MQNKNKTVVHSTTNLQQGYHQTSSYDVNYAYQGWEKLLAFTSDRTIPMSENFERADGKENNFFGTEMEVGCNGITTSNEALCQVLRKICFEKLPSNLFKFQRDGSLRGSTSIECITQCMTKEFIRNNYPAWKYAYEMFKMFDILPSGSRGCGMHVNMSNALFGKQINQQQEAIRKFVYFVNKYYEISCALFKRSLNQTNYCGRMNSWTDKNYAKSFDFDYLDEGDSNHYICWNLAHYPTGRIELRLVGGQETYFSFRNTMETIFHLVSVVKSISWKDIDDITKVFNGCNKYVLKRIDDIKSANLITAEQYQIIKDNCDMSVDFGNC